MLIDGRFVHIGPSLYLQQWTPWLPVRHGMGQSLLDLVNVIDFVDKRQTITREILLEIIDFSVNNGLKFLKPNLSKSVGRLTLNQSLADPCSPLLGMIKLVLKRTLKILSIRFLLN